MKFKSRSPLFASAAAAFAMLAFAATARCDEAATKEDKVVAVLTRTHAADLFLKGMEANMPKLLNSFRAKNPYVTEPQLAEIQKVLAQSLADLQGAYVKVVTRAYVTVYDDAEIDLLYSLSDNPVWLRLQNKGEMLRGLTADYIRSWSLNEWVPDYQRRMRSDRLLEGLRFD